MSELNVYFLPDGVRDGDLDGRTVVVIDILRATTTIIHALGAGAAEVIPCLEVDEARQAARDLGKAAILGGERSGGKIAGFELGNSPAEYTAKMVAGKTLVFTTTNGTRAMLHCRDARRVLLGAFVNFSAICRALKDENSVALLCAGTNGQITREDVLFAGAVVYQLADEGSHSKGAPAWELNDQALIAAAVWWATLSDVTPKSLAEQLRSSIGGRNLLGMGHGSDIDLAAQIDKFDFVPKLDLSTWRIRKV